MNRFPRSGLSIATTLAVLLMTSAFSKSSQAGLISNGGFEAGFAGWTTAAQIGSEGSFALQSGTTSPDGFFSVPAPPGGSSAAMTSAGLGGPGSYVLYQDFVIPTDPSTLPRLSFDLFVGNRADDFFLPNPATLDFSPSVIPPPRNQQARVDILRIGTDPFSVAAADVLLNVFQTMPGGPLVSGYNKFVADLTPLIAANGGQTVRLRFAEVDNVNFFQLGVDNVQVDTVPEPSSLAIFGLGALIGLACSIRLPSLSVSVRGYPRGWDLREMDTPGRR